MTTSNESVTRSPVGAAQTQVTLNATFNAETDVTGYVALTGPITFQGSGPVDAQTIALQRSTVDPSAGAGNPVEVVDETGAAAGVSGLYAGVGTAWYRLQNKATFGPANTVTARSLLSLGAAINGLQPAVNYFAPGTTPQPLVHASVGSTALKMNLTAATAGAAGNSIATTETLANGSFANATLTGGADLASAIGTATFATAAAENGATVTIGGQVYTFRTALTTPATANEVLRGATLTASRDNLLAAINLGGTVSAGLLTFASAPTAGETVRIRNFVYTFRDSLVGFQDQPRQVLIGVSVTTARNNLVSAINGTAAGNGVAYSSATVKSVYFSAGTSGANMTVASISETGVASQYITTETSSHLSWGAAALVSPAGAGVTYGSDTALNASVTGSAISTNQLRVTAKVGGTVGNAIGTTTTSAANVAWGAATLASGANLAFATGVLTMTDVPVTTNTVTIGSVVYTFKAALTPTAGEVQIATTKADVVLTGIYAGNV